jgi:tRNA-2-methylthio-N6-dimethylallyladenosine synthase
MPHFHLPVQSGSNGVLKRMRRNYTWEEYVGRVDHLRRLRPDVALTSDIIVAFPGETDEDFEATMKLIDLVRFANLYSFVYSPRPHTSAGRHEEEWGKIPREIAVARLERLQLRQREITLEMNRELVGRPVEVLVEGPSRTDATRRMGRTAHNNVVNFAGSAPAGAFASVEIDSASVVALSGTERSHVAPPIAVEKRRVGRLPIVAALA